MENKANKTITLFVYVAFAIMIIPFLLMLLTSVKSMGEIISPKFVYIPEKWMISNYVEAMQMGNWGRYFLNTIYVSFFTTIVSVTVNSIAGYSFARIEFKGRDILFIVALLGMMIPPQVTMIPVFLILKHVPLVGGNNIFGQDGMGWLDSHMGLILPYVAGSFLLFLFRQFFMNFPSDLDDAANIDGLNKFSSYYRIYVPLSKPIIATAIVLKIAHTWNEYTWPLILTMSEDMRTVQLALALFRLDVFTRWDLLMSATTLIMLPLVIIFLFTQRYFIEGIVTTGSKN